MKNQIEQVSAFYGPPEPGVFYRTTCSCGSTEHDLNIELEHDEEFGFASIRFYINCVWEADWNLNWFQRLYRRIKASMKLLFCGKIILEQDFIFRGKDHINGLLEALTEGVEKLEKNNKQKPPKIR